MTYLAKRSDGTDMPAFITFDAVNRIYYIQTSGVDASGEYNLRVTATFDYRGVQLKAYVYWTL